MEKEEVEKSIDSVTDQEREYAQNALNEFNEASYANCLQNINKLENRTYDFKVAHNKAVIEYYKSELKKIDQFQKSLNNIFNQVLVAKPILKTKFHMKLEKLDDVDHCVCHFNQAILLYHQRQYTVALRIMDRVYKFIEPMDDTLSKQVGLLMIELQLCIRQPEKALGLITYLQNQSLNGTTNVKINLKHSKTAEKEHKEKLNKVSPQLNPAVELFLKKLAKYRAKCYVMNHSVNLAKKEIQELGGSDKTNVEYLFLFANQEYFQGNFQESVKILTTIPVDSLKYSDCGESSTVMFYNNMGVLHHAMGKPNLACHYYQKALQEDADTTSSKDADKSLWMMGGSRYHEIMYNLGISLLYAGKPQQAFECLIVAVRRYHRNSRLWLRLAECCILVHRETNEVDFDIKQKKKEFVIECVGTNGNKKLILTTNLSKDKKYSTESQSYAVPVPTLEFAILCLRNAQLLLPTNVVSSPVPLLVKPGITPPAPPPSPGPAPSNSISNEEVINLRNSIFTAGAYVSLCLGDYIMTLEYSDSLLNQQRKSGIHILLAHLYAAEALILLDKIQEALQHLHPDHVKDMSHELPSDGNGDDVPLKTNPPFKWFPSTRASIVALFQYNLAVVMTIRGQLDQAATLARQIWQSSQTTQVPAHILMLVLYIELKLGHVDIARSLIKQYSLQYKFV